MSMFVSIRTDLDMKISAARRRIVVQCHVLHGLSDDISNMIKETIQ